MITTPDGKKLNIETPSPKENIDYYTDRLIGVVPNGFAGDIASGTKEVYVLIRGDSEKKYKIFVLDLGLDKDETPCPAASQSETKSQGVSQSK